MPLISRLANKTGGTGRPSTTSRLMKGALSAAALVALGAIARSTAWDREYAVTSWPSDYVLQEGLLTSAENVYIPRTNGGSRSSGTPEKRFVRFRIEGSPSEFTTWAIHDIELQRIGKAHLRTYAPRRSVGDAQVMAHGLWIDGREYETLDQAHQLRIARSRDLWLPAGSLVVLTGLSAWMFFRALFPRAAA